MEEHATGFDCASLPGPQKNEGFGPMHGLDTRIRSCNIIATVLLGFLVFGQRFSLETRTAPVYPVLPLLCKLTSVSSVPSDLGSPGTTGLCVCSHHWHFLGIFWSASVEFFWVPDLMAVQLNVASGNENTQGLWRGTVPDGRPKHRGSLGNGKFDQGR